MLWSEVLTSASAVLSAFLSSYNSSSHPTVLTFVVVCLFVYSNLTSFLFGLIIGFSLAHDGPRRCCGACGELFVAFVRFAVNRHVVAPVGATVSSHSVHSSISAAASSLSASTRPSDLSTVHLSTSGHIADVADIRRGAGGEHRDPAAVPSGSGRNRVIVQSTVADSRSGAAVVAAWRGSARERGIAAREYAAAERIFSSELR